METGNTVFKELESNEQVPEYLRKALVSEVDTIRDSMQVVTHFTEFFLKTLITCFSVEKTEDPNT